MRILQAASEAFPFCKTGGLADVVGTLCQKLGQAGHDVLLFLPKYRVIAPAALRGAKTTLLDVPLGAGRVRVALRRVQWRSVAVQFVDCPELFDRDCIYGEDGRDYPDSDKRFSVFCRAALEGAKAVGFRPDIVHAHDWPTALAPLYLATLYARDPFFAASASVLTVHNMAYQGVFPARGFLQAGFAAPQFRTARLGSGRGGAARYSFLKAGLVHADRLNTVSPTYAGEIQTAVGGHGLQAVLRRRRGQLTGILNGLDLECWNPEKDALLPARFSAQDMAGKRECKRKFLVRYGLKAAAGAPLVGMVGRLDRQKGWDVAIKALGPRLRRCCFMGMGEGDRKLVASVKKWTARHPGAARFFCGYNEELAHRLYAAADIIVMPSRFEPCGLGQMIAMRYGCVPVVSRTGGLADTVSDYPTGNGFTALPDDALDFGRAVDRALDAFAGPDWAAMARAGMGRDFSWGRSVRLYLDVYARALAGRGG